jgi:hypothetical protein
MDRQNCGVEIYADYPTLDRDMLHRFYDQLPYKNNKQLATIPHYKRAPSNSSHKIQHDPGRPTIRGVDGSSSIMGSTAPNSYSTNSTRPARHSLHVASTGNISAGSSQPRRYLELCINTSRRHICLRELLLNGSGSKPTQSDIQTDAQLFQKIHDTYLEVRRGSRFSFLYSPIDIHFVQFSTFDGGRVGIYEKPMALPPVEQVEGAKYHYHECALEPLPPIDHRTFFHYFWNHSSHLHSRSTLFLNRLPKKMNTSVREQEQPDALNLGWGLHIIEGPNRKMLSLSMFVILVVSLIISITYSIVTHAQESGFGIGQWMVATFTAGLGAVYFHLAD